MAIRFSSILLVLLLSRREIKQTENYILIFSLLGMRINTLAQVAKAKLAQNFQCLLLLLKINKRSARYSTFAANNSI